MVKSQASIRRAYRIGKKRGYRKGFKEGWETAYKFINDLTVFQDKRKKNEKVR